MASDLKAMAAEFKLRSGNNSITKSTTLQAESSIKSAQNIA
jgi:hypothetical protein